MELHITYYFEITYNKLSSIKYSVDVSGQLLERGSLWFLSGKQPPPVRTTKSLIFGGH